MSIEVVEPPAVEIINAVAQPIVRSLVAHNIPEEEWATVFATLLMRAVTAMGIDFAFYCEQLAQSFRKHTEGQAVVS